MCFEVVKGYGLALMVTVAQSGAGAGWDFVLSEPIRAYAAERFVRDCLWQRWIG